MIDPDEKPKDQFAKLDDFLDMIRVFYPIVCVVIFTPLTIFYGQPWFGLVLFTLIIWSAKTWYTDLFGLLNFTLLFGGFAWCLIETVRLLRDAGWRL